MTPHPKIFAYSWDQEGYFGKCDSREAAIAEAGSGPDGERRLWTAEVVDPVLAEGLIDADDVLDQIRNHEDYSHEWAEDWPICSTEQKQDLTESIQKAVGDWITRHNMRPDFYTIDWETVQEHSV